MLKILLAVAAIVFLVSLLRARAAPRAGDGWERDYRPIEPGSVRSAARKVRRRAVGPLVSLALILAGFLPALRSGKAVAAVLGLAALYVVALVVRAVRSEE